MSDNDLHRVFFALPVPREAGEKLERWRRTLALDTGYPVPLANLHLTLSFLGEIDRHALDNLLDADMRGCTPFTLSFGELGYFSKAKILFAAPHETPPELLTLAQHCRHLQRLARAGKTETDFVPHISLAREVLPPVPAAMVPLNLDLRCHEVHLMRSLRLREGVRYETVASWPLMRPLRPQPK